MSIEPAFGRLRDSKHTGENRCLSCTINNIAVTLVISIWLWVAWPPAAVAFGAIALGVIAFRGYLLPRTPWVVAEYFPGPVQAMVELLTPPAGDSGDEHTVSVDTEQVLIESGPLKPCAEIDDLCLTPTFREAWYDRMASISADDAERAALLETLETDGEIAYVDHGEAFSAHVDGTSIGQWESHAAFVADLALVRELPRWVPQWETFNVVEQGTIIRGIRVFLDLCPSCSGQVTPDQETVESCCREHTVLTLTCDGCGARLFESVAESSERGVV